jgi:hypothetical protein
MKQTAVDFVINKLNPLVNQMPNEIFSIICNILIEAKAMEKEQILKALYFGKNINDDIEAEQYYNETYN